MNLYVTGPLAVSKDFREKISSYNFSGIYGLSSPDWSFHSSKESIAAFINGYTEENVRFILFHAFPKNIKKFSSEFSEAAQGRIGVISKTELTL